MAGQGRYPVAGLVKHCLDVGCHSDVGFIRGFVMVRVIRRIAVIGFILGFGLVLAGCDKCGNNIFRMQSCKDMQPRS